MDGGLSRSVRRIRRLLAPTAAVLVAGGMGAGAASATVAPAGHHRAGLTRASRPAGVAVGGLHGVTAVSTGVGFFMALLKDGRVDTWGNNYDGQLGDGTTARSASPVQVKGLSSVTAISAGGFTVWPCWLAAR